MENLWAPWRMEYILDQSQDQGCIFCPGDVTSFDRERLILHVGPRTLVLMNKYPYNNGHLLIAPKRHLPEPRHLSPEETAELWDAVNKSLDCLQELMNPDGFNVGLNLGQAAGAGLTEHLHVHLVPRWVGDTNFMTVLGEVRSVPEHLKRTFDRLRPLIARTFGED
ncbi:MAG: HIT domain-containing protein [Deltaproteobacteria bacterium]|nr:HIT domain-containing protein [Deltaproteobacteria bacterium]